MNKPLNIPCPLYLTLDKALIMQAGLQTAHDVTGDPRLAKIEKELGAMIDVVLIAAAGANEIP